MEVRAVLIPAIHCGHCLATIRRELGELPGVSEVSGDATSKTVTIRYGPPADWGQVESLLREIGYPPAPLPSMG